MRRRHQRHLESQGMNSRRRREALARSQEDRRHRDANQRPALSPESRISNRSEASRWAWERLLEARSRSEEHTSELQSRLHLVCRLLLEKKNNRLSTI